ncbi:MAG: bifunctional UDP-N-acetylglucosamine diphosphorylase/glucosamine-1-phosphate N-acetyltransferase GlmU [Methylococcaceae bacterium]
MILDITILAAGQGKRMKSSKPKVLHCVGAYTLLDHVYQTAREINPNKIWIVYGHGGEQVLHAMPHLNVDWIAQTEQRGTGHAVARVSPHLEDNHTVLVLYGDVPLITPETLRRLLSLGEPSCSLNLLTVKLENPYGYGRIVRAENGKVLQIVEEKDASAEQKTICEVNTGILCTTAALLKTWVSRLSNQNQQQEYYLTDIVAMAVADGIPIHTTTPEGMEEVLGVNTRAQLAILERAYQRRQVCRLMDSGVTLRDPERIDIRGEITIVGQDVEFDINVVMEGNVRIGTGVKVGPHVVLKNVSIGDYTEVLAHSIIENASIGSECRIGPFARIRPETTLANRVHIGNFVEIKKTGIGSNTKINHLSYVGDAVVGQNVNIGAGTITCNYDGVNKHQTIIEDGAFIGSDTQLVAPVRVEQNATIGAGSTITRDAPTDALTLSRATQKTIEGWKRPAKKV